MTSIAEARAAHARALTQQRSDQVRAGIRRAIPSEVKYRGLWTFGLATLICKRIDRLGPEMFGLDGPPYRETVSSVIRQLRAEQGSALEPALVAMTAARVQYVCWHSATASST